MVFEYVERYITVKPLPSWSHGLHRSSFQSSSQKWFNVFLIEHIYLRCDFKMMQADLRKTVSHSYSLCIIRFPITFHIGFSISRRCETFKENAITCFIGFTGVETCVGFKNRIPRESGQNFYVIRFIIFHWVRISIWV